jgi:hypothetical protein
VEILLNILCWQAVQGYDERCVKYNELVRESSVKNPSSV